MILIMWETLIHHTILVVYFNPIYEVYYISHRDKLYICFEQQKPIN